ncbi:MAG: hypothetical protein ABR592_00330 [Nitriliruptorales bacterium]
MGERSSGAVMIATAPQAAQERVPRPVILTVDEDPDALRAVERDLKRHYAANYRALRSASESPPSTLCVSSNVGASRWPWWWPTSAWPA